MNQRNFGMAEGRLTREPKVFVNDDGSKHIKFTLATRRNYKDKNGNVGSDFVQLEAFVKAEAAKGKTVYDYMHKGDLVGAEYTVRTDKYTDKNGEEVYTQSLVVQTIDLKETKSTTEKRAEENRAKQATEPATDTVPSDAQFENMPAPEDTPFDV